LLVEYPAWLIASSARMPMLSAGRFSTTPDLSKDS
jgi:hypothetical protein